MTDVILEHALKTKPINWESGLGADGAHREAYIGALRATGKNNYLLLIEFVSG